MTLCDLIILLELVALAVAGIRIWHLGDERNRVVAELDEAYLAGSAVRVERDRLGDAPQLREDRRALVVQIIAQRRAMARVTADRDAHADRAQQLARRVTELEGRLSEAGSRIDELIADNAAALGIQSGGGR